MIISALVGADNVCSLREFCIFDIQKPRRPHRHNDIIASESHTVSNSLSRTDAGMILAAIVTRSEILACGRKGPHERAVQETWESHGSHHSGESVGIRC
jgi:hypothetical protein